MVRVSLITFLVVSAALGQTGTLATSIVAGNGLADGALATTVALSNMNGLAVDTSGNLFVASQNSVFKVSPSRVITRVAGNGTSGYSGDGALAMNAQLNAPTGIAIDGAGNLYIADSGNSRIRKVSGGVITTVAGNGTSGYSGDNGAATAASIGSVNGITTDSAGNLYIADSTNYRIRKVSAGVITTIAGNGTAAYSGDGGLATSAQIGNVYGVAVDAAGNIYFADSSNYRIRKIASGIVTTIVGTGTSGYSGDGGQATTAQIGWTYSLTFDNSGNLYLGDGGNARIRKVSGGIITTVAGNGIYGYTGDGGQATSSAITSALGVAVASGKLFIADSGNYRVRQVSGGVITTVAGNGTYRYSGDGGIANSAQVNPDDVAVDASGNVYIADLGDHRIRKVSGGVITTAVGTGTIGFSGDGGLATAAQISDGSALAVNSSGNLYIADASNYRIRKVSSGIITTVAGNGTFGYSGDGGPPTSAQIGLARGIAVDSQGSIYIADQSNRIRKVSGGVITLYAGGGPPDGSSATSVSVTPNSVALDATGNLYIPSIAQNRVYKVSPAGIINTVAGTGISGFSGDGGSATNAQLNSPVAVAVDSTGNLYIADANNSRVRKVSGGLITTIAGAGGGCAQQTDIVGDGCPAAQGSVHPQGLAVDAADNLYIADSGNYRIRKISGGIITSIAGNGSTGYSGDGGPATAAQLGYPSDVVVNSAGTVYIADAFNNRIRMVSGGVIVTVAGNGGNGYSGDGGAATSAQINLPGGIAVDSAGALYIADSGNSRIRKVSGGVITTVAGGGSGCAQQTDSVGDGCSPISARLSPGGIALDALGNLYIADSGNSRTRKVSGGVIATIAGNGFSSYSGDGGSALTAQLGSPAGLAMDNAGNLYVADSGSSRVRVISSAGTITTFAGGGTQGAGDGISATDATLSSPTSVALDNKGDVYIGDSGNHLLRRVSGGLIDTITTFAGGGSYPFPGDGGLAVDSSNRIYASDPGDGRVRRLAPENSSLQADFNDDGYEDVIWQDSTTGLAQIWILGGAQGATVLGGVNLTASNPWRIVGVGDFDRDGRPDVVWQDPATGAAQVWFLGGTEGNVVTSAAVLSVGNTWRIRSVADFNKDGHPDLIWQDQASGWAQIWFMGGAQGTTFLNAINLTLNNTWRIAGTADFNGDGVPDVVWQDPVSGAVQVWYLGGPQGNVVQTAQTLIGANSWRIAAVGDYNGDGHPDMVWQDPVTGAAQVWFLGGSQGITINGSTSLSPNNVWRIAGPHLRESALVP